MLNHIVEYFPYPILLLSKEGKIVYCNLFTINLFGYEIQELIGKNFIDYTSSEYKSIDSSIFSEFQANKPFISNIEKKILHKLGQEVWVKQTSIPLKFESEEYNYLLVTMENISFQKAKQELVTDKEELFNSFFYKNNAIKLLIDPSTGSIVEANDAACKFYGYTPEQFSKMKIFEINAMTNEQIKLEMEKAAKRKQAYFHFPHRLANGEIRIVEVHTGPIHLKNKPLLLSIIHDITNQYNLVQETSHEFESNFLLNRIRLIQEINLLLKSKTHEFSYALVWIDIDHFSHVKLKYSTEISNELLKQVFQRIRAEFKTTIYLLAEDEFGILLQTKNEIKNLKDLIKKLFFIFSSPFEIQNENISISASFGICLISNENKEAKQVFELANSALLEAKLNGRNTFFITNTHIDSEVKTSLKLEKTFKHKLDSQDFEVLYQPILKKPNLLYSIYAKTSFDISSNEFLEILKNSQFYENFYLSFFRMLNKQLQEWIREGFFIPLVYVPFLELGLDTQTYKKIFYSIIEVSGINPKGFVLDLTYSEEQETILENLISEFRSLGFSLSLSINAVSTSILKNLETWNINSIQIHLKSFPFSIEKKAHILSCLLGFFQGSSLSFILNEVEESELETFFKLGLNIFQNTSKQFYRGELFLSECIAKGIQI